MSLLRLLSVVVLVLIGTSTVAACGEDEETASSGDQAAAGDGAAVDRAFVAAMIPHHESAIEMAEIAQERGESRFVEDLAADIVEAQSSEIETLRRVDAELEAAGVEPGDLGVESMQGMEGMEGMESDPAELRDADPFDKAFVDMMVPHHRSAIEMAKAELEKGENAELKAIARDIVEAQQREIDEMNAFREKEYGAPVPDTAASGDG